MIATLARPAVSRLLGSARTWAQLGGWGALAVAFALAARARGAAHGADRVLVDAYGALVLPLLAYAIVGAVLGARSLSAAIASLVAFGAAPRRAAAATLLVALGASAAVGAVLAAVVALVAHGAADPPLARDALASAYAGALGGAAYAGWFALGASFGKRGGGRTAFLVVDWLLDGTGGVFALVTPRAHLRNLLGGAPPLELAERASAVALVVLALAGAAVAIARTRR
jgi:hypothetical protein